MEPAIRSQQNQNGYSVRNGQSTAWPATKLKSSNNTIHYKTNFGRRIGLQSRLKNGSSRVILCRLKKKQENHSKAFALTALEEITSAHNEFHTGTAARRIS
jgi:hypothetical protein